MNDRTGFDVIPEQSLAAGSPALPVLLASFGVALSAQALHGVNALLGHLGGVR